MSGRRCATKDCTARVKGQFRLCRICRIKAAVRKATQRARGKGPATDGNVTGSR